MFGLGVGSNKSSRIKTIVNKAISALKNNSEYNESTVESKKFLKFLKANKLFDDAYVSILPSSYNNELIKAALPSVNENLLKGSNRVVGSSSSNYSFQPTGSATITDGVTSPIGSTDAIKITRGTNDLVARGSDLVKRQETYTFSIYAKKDDGADAATSIVIDIADGTVQQYTLTNEWQRFTVTGYAQKYPENTYDFLDIALIGGSTSRYAYIWGAQLQRGTKLTAYQSTSVANIIPRGDMNFERHSSGTYTNSEGVIVDKQSQTEVDIFKYSVGENLMPQTFDFESTNYFSVAWSPSNGWQVDGTTLTCSGSGNVRQNVEVDSLVNKLFKFTYTISESNNANLSIKFGGGASQPVVSTVGTHTIILRCDATVDNIQLLSGGFSGVIENPIANRLDNDWLFYQGWTLKDLNGVLTPYRSNYNINTFYGRNVVQELGLSYKVSYERLYESGATSTTNLYAQFQNNSDFVTLGNYAGQDPDFVTVTDGFKSLYAGTQMYRLYGIGDFTGYVRNFKVEKLIGIELLSLDWHFDGTFFHRTEGSTNSSFKITADQVFAGDKYYYEFDYNVLHGSFTAYIGGTTLNNGSFNGSGTAKGYVVAGGNSEPQFYGLNDARGTISNIVIRNVSFGGDQLSGDINFTDLDNFNLGDNLNTYNSNDLGPELLINNLISKYTERTTNIGDKDLGVSIAGWSASTGRDSGEQTATLFYPIENGVGVRVIVADDDAHGYKHRLKLNNVGSLLTQGKQYMFAFEWNSNSTASNAKVGIRTSNSTWNLSGNVRNASEITPNQFNRHYVLFEASAPPTGYTYNDLNLEIWLQTAAADGDVQARNMTLREVINSDQSDFVDWVQGGGDYTSNNSKHNSWRIIDEGTNVIAESDFVGPELIDLTTGSGTGYTANNANEVTYSGNPSQIQYYDTGLQLETTKRYYVELTLLQYTNSSPFDSGLSTSGIGTIGNNLRSTHPATNFEYIVPENTSELRLFVRPGTTSAKMRLSVKEFKATPSGSTGTNDWNDYASNITVKKGYLEVDGNQSSTIGFYKNIAAISQNTKVKVSFEVFGRTAGQVNPAFYGSSGQTVVTGSSSTSSNGNYEAIIEVGSGHNGNTGLQFSSDFDGGIRNLSFIKDTNYVFDSATPTAYGTISKNTILTRGKEYLYTFDFVRRASVLEMKAGNNFNGYGSEVFDSTGTKKLIAPAIDNSGFNFTSSTTFEGSFDNLQIQEVNKNGKWILRPNMQVTPVVTDNNTFPSNLSSIVSLASNDTQGFSGNCTSTSSQSRYGIDGNFLNNKQYLVTFDYVAVGSTFSIYGKTLAGGSGTTITNAINNATTSITMEVGSGSAMFTFHPNSDTSSILILQGTDASDPPSHNFTISNLVIQEYDEDTGWVWSVDVNDKMYLEAKGATNDTLTIDLDENLVTNGYYELIYKITSYSAGSIRPCFVRHGVNDDYFSFQTRNSNDGGANYYKELIQLNSNSANGRKRLAFKCVGFTGKISDVKLRRVDHEINLPRIAYTNDSGGFTGDTKPAYLFEPTRTNNVYTSHFWRPRSTTSNSSYTSYLHANTYFSANHLVISDAESPEGQMNAFRIYENATNNQHYAAYNWNCTKGENYVISFFVKKGTYSSVKFYTASAYANSNITINWNGSNITSLAIDGSNHVSNSAHYDEYPNGWYRVSYGIKNVLQDGTGSFYVAPKDLTTYQGDTNNNIYVFGLQIESGLYLSDTNERGYYPTTYIPTQSKIQTRNRDKAWNTIAKEFMFDSNEGTILFDVARLHKINSNKQSSISISYDNPSTSNNRIMLYQSSGASQFNVQHRMTVSDTSDLENATYQTTANGGTAHALINQATNALSSPQVFSKIAYSWKDGKLSLYQDGVHVTTKYSLPTHPSGEIVNFFTTATMDNEYNESESAEGNIFTGYIRNFTIFERSLDDGELALITGETSSYESYNAAVTAGNYTII